MNGAVYISFFQGQLESVLEQVVQLAVQEISKSVGSSLNALLLETAVKEQENRRLRLQLQSRDTRGRAPDGGGGGGGGGGSSLAAKNKTGKAAGDERADGGRTKPEQPQQQLHAAGGQGLEPGVPTDTRRLEQRGRVVDQLKSVMEQVLDFAVRELTKIVEASFDDLLLEITKMEREQQVLEERLGKGPERGGGEKGRAGGGRRRGSENDSVSPSGSEDAREEAEVPVAKETAVRDAGPQPPPVLSVAQDWVPILDKVFGQKWCSDVWQIKELGARGEEEAGAGVRGGSEEGAPCDETLAPPSVTLEPSPSSPQQDPRWTPLEDMEVFSPDEDDAAAAAAAAAAAVPQSTNSNTATPAPAAGGGAAGGGAAGGGGAASSPTGRRSSASMLQRLLTLPSQLLDEEESEDSVAKEKVVVMATDGTSERGADTEPPYQATQGGEEEEEDGGEEEDEEEEDKGRKKKRRRVWSECEECGRRFSRMSLLKAHRHTHASGNAAAEAASPSSPSAASLPLRCSECGKRFSSATRLHSHARAQHAAPRS